LAEWLVEEGIGEHRAIRLEGDRIAAARLRFNGALTAGQVNIGKLISRNAGSPRGVAQFAWGPEALVDGLPRSASEGAEMRFEITRPALAERGQLKRARARPTDAEPRSAPTLAETLAAEGHSVRVVHRFPAGDWDELMAEAFAGEISFAGGTLLFCPTPAMLLVDVDGTLPPRELAMAAVPALASALRRFDIGGSVGIDFPTLSAKADRRAVDDALEAALGDWPHERTAMNGFGFVQIVARLERLSLLHLATYHRAGTAFRQLLRRAEGLEGAGDIELTFNPALKSEFEPDIYLELLRRTGRNARGREDPALALEAPQAQLVPR
jgi:hypothetical protein